MANENVGGISYSLELETSKLIEGQRQVEKSLDQMNGRFRDSAGRLREANGQFVKTGEAAADAAKDVSKFSFALTPIAAGVAMAFATGAVVAFTSKIIEVQREFDKLNAMLQTATGSKEGAQAAFAALQEFAAKTPYDLAQVTKAFTQLVNLGLTPSERALTSYGNTASAMGKNLGQLVEAVADAITGEFERLKEFGIKSKAEGDKVIFTFRGVKTEVANSASEIEKYLIALGENEFGGAMALQAATLDGAISNLADSWNSLLRTISSSGMGDAISDTVRVGIEVIDALIGALGEGEKQMTKADAKAEEIRRADNIKEWAESSISALAVLADAADVVWQTLSVLGRNVAFVFQGIGTEIGGIGAQVAAVLQGDFKRAGDIGDMMKADANKRRAELDKADAATLADRMSWGDKIRAQMGKNSKAVNGVDRLAGFKVGAEGGATGGGSSSKGRKGKSEAQKAAEEWAKWEEKQRMESVIADRKYREEQAQLADQEVRDQLKREEEKARAQYEISQQIGGLTALDAEFEAKAQKLQEYLNQELITQEQHDLAMIALAQQTSDRVAEIQKSKADEQMQTQQQLLSSYSSMFDGLAGLVESFGSKQTGAYRALFAVSKAFSIAESIMAIQTASAKAMALGFPANIGELARVGSLGAGIIGSIKGMNFGGGRQYGGPVSSGSLYRVNETGQPEMFTASNGKQYMMPTSNGNVTPANQLGGAGGVSIVVNNNVAGADVQATASPDGRMIEIAVNRAVAEVAGQFRTNSGQVWQAAKGSTNIQGKTA